MTDILATADDPTALVTGAIQPALTALLNNPDGLVKATGQVALIDTWLSAHPPSPQWSSAPPHRVITATDTKRDALAANRARVTAFLAAFDSVRFNLSGSAVSAIIARVAPARTGVATALTAIASVGLAGLPAAAVSLASAVATARAVGSDLDALVAALALPPLADV